MISRDNGIRLPLGTALLVLFLAAVISGQQARREPADVIAPPDAFNGVVLTARDRSSPAERRSLGFANIGTGQPFDEHTRTQIGSISKFLTSAAVLRLVEQQTLALDVSIATWLPFLDGTARMVTLRHLLTNTSGIPNGVMDSYRKDPEFTSKDVPALEAARLWGTGELKFNPGTEWDYSLTNWVLVRAIMEVSTGKSFDAILQDELIAPLGLEDTGVPGPTFPNGPADAIPYASLQPIQPGRNAIPPYAAASGTIYSSASDLRAFMDGLFGGRFLSAASLRELTTVHVEKEGYALGGRVVDLAPARRILWESGETSSYRALVAYDPDSGACVVLLDNAGAPAESVADAARTMMRALLAGGSVRPPEG